jgi:hypothetical protein
MIQTAPTAGTSGPVFAGNPRISGRLGQLSQLNIDFYHNGQLADPFAIRRIDIYRAVIQPQNLFASIPLLSPTDPLYPAPVVRTDVGQYYYPYPVPANAVAPEVYEDIWYYHPTDPAASGTASTPPYPLPYSGTYDILNDYDNCLIANCHRFWVYPNNWYTDDRLMSIQFGFEPLRQRFHSGDYCDLDIGVMPLPLYDFDYNLVMPLIPWMTASIHVETRNAEILIQNEQMSVGLRQGTFRTNPFVLRWRLDARRFLIGTYRYRVTVYLPNGVIQASPWYIFSIS